MSKIISTAMAVASLFAVLACTFSAPPPPTTTPDIPATVAFELSRIPTATPHPTPNVPATVAFELSQIPTATPYPTYTPHPTPSPIPSPTPIAGGLVTPEQCLLYVGAILGLEAGGYSDAQTDIIFLREGWEASWQLCAISGYIEELANSLPD